jgi:hypothetical protein
MFEACEQPAVLLYYLSHFTPCTVQFRPILVILYMMYCLLLNVLVFYNSSAATYNYIKIFQTLLINNELMLVTIAIPI